MDWFKKCLFGFKVIYLLYLLLAFNAFVNGTGWMNQATYVIAGVGSILSVGVLLSVKRYRRIVCAGALVLFVYSYALSAAAHMSYAGIAENIKGLIWLVLPISLVYVPAFDMSRKEIEWEAERLSVLYIAYCTAANLISLSMVVWGRMYEYKDSAGAVHAIGYRWERLWGVYDDPNHGAVITVVAAFFIFYLYGKTKKLLHKGLLIICFAISYMYIALSDSRTGLVCLTVGAVMYILLGVYRIIRTAGEKPHEKKKSIRKKLLLLVASVCLILVGDAALKAAYHPLDTIIANREKTTSVPGKNIRKENLEQDYSNGRLELWKNGLEITAASPVIGVGYRNMSAYAAEQFPDAYMVKNAAGIPYDSMHNLELDVLVSQGVIGAGIFLFVLIKMVGSILRRIPVISKNDEKVTTFMLAAAMALAAASTFLSFIFYVNAPQTFCFWLLLGYGMSLLTKEEGVSAV